MNHRKPTKQDNAFDNIKPVDGRPTTVDEETGNDRLLDQLQGAHGLAGRPDLAKELKRQRRRPQKNIT